MSAQPLYRHLDELPPWNDQSQVLECVAVLPETHNVKTFCFKSPDESWFRYLPGQFITLELPVGGDCIHRTYTLSSSPSRPLLICITVKRQPESLGSRWLFDEVDVGSRLKAYGPAGIFSFHHHAAEKYLFVSAGSGITPMMSMARWLFDNGRHSDVTFINCARRPSEIIFRAELERMAARVPSFNLAWIVSEADPYSVWTGYRGRLNGLMLELIAPDYFDREIFCCGPAGFMQGLRDALNAAGYDMERYHEESFLASIGAPGELDEPDDVIPDENKKACIRFAKSDREAYCHETDTILDVAKDIGLTIPSGCQFGVCGTCKVRCLAGETHMVHNGGIRDEEIADGYVLACCTKPIGQVDLDL